MVDLIAAIKAKYQDAYFQYEQADPKDKPLKAKWAGMMNGLAQALMLIDMGETDGLLGML